MIDKARLWFVLVAVGLLGLFIWFSFRVTTEVEIGGFTTSLSERSPQQISNLRIALGKIDGLVIKSGEIFSFNKVVGERLEKWGYSGAPTIYNGEIVNTPGGGLCQLSSTLYNTALLSGLEIEERTPHLWVINSVGPGRDATILYDKIDLKFKNNLSVPIRIRGDISSSRLSISFFSTAPLKYKVEIQEEILQYYEPPTFPRYPRDSDSSLPSSGKKGYKVKVYRIFYDGDKVIRKEVISTDKYVPVPGGDPNP